MPAGRPLKFKTVEELDIKIQSYFDSCFEEVVDGEVKKKNQIKPLTITGLAIFLDTSRDTLLDYKEKPEYSDSIKKALAVCENYAEEKLFGNNVAGVIFNLKNNYGWKDKTEQDITSGGKSIVPTLEQKGESDNLINSYLGGNTKNPN